MHKLAKCSETKESELREKEGDRTAIPQKQMQKINSPQQPSQKRPRLLALFPVTLVAVLLLWILPALTQQPVVLTMLMQGQDITNWRPFVKEFEQKNPDIRINLIEGPFDTNLIENLYTSAFLLGESPYDIINMDIVWVPKFAAAGWVRDLTDRIPPQQLSKFIQGNVEGGRYRGKLYRIPHASDDGMLYYRKDILEQAGIPAPKTFEDMVKISQNLQKVSS